MKYLTFALSSIHQFEAIKKKLIQHEPIVQSERKLLISTLSKILDAKLTADNPYSNETFSYRIFEQTNEGLEKWVELFDNLPGWDYCPHSFFVDQELTELLKNRVIISAWFAPSYSYNRLKHRPCEIWLKDDGTAHFHFPTLSDAEQYPELYNFKGPWKEAYLLLIETLKRGWPMKEFPAELEPLLKN